VWDMFYLGNCLDLQFGRQEAFATIDAENDYLISSGIYSKIADAFEATIQREKSTATKIIYNTMQTLNTDIMFAFARSLTADKSWNQEMFAASNLIFELTTDGKVNGFLNDAQMNIEGCPKTDDCSVADFVKTLRSKSAVKAETTCQVKTVVYE
jgi:hypothetical protein